MLYKKQNTDEEIINMIKESAKCYSEFCGKDFLYVAINKNKNNLFMFEAKYQAKHFQHLCGIRSKTMTATEFYYECLKEDSKLLIQDCTPSYEHSKSDIIDKLSSFPRLFDITNLKTFRTGQRIPGVGNIDFDFAVGDTCFIGYKFNPKEKKYIPFTNMISPIASYCTSPKRISIVLSKNYDEQQYNKIEYEVTPNLINKIDIDIKEALLNFISPHLIKNELSKEVVNDILQEK